MSKTVLVLLLVCAITLQETHAWWDNGSTLEYLEELGDETLHTALHTAAQVAITAAVGAALGKRDAEKGGILSDDVRQQLEESCPVLLGTDKDGEHQDVVHQAVSESDADGDGALSWKEMEAFTQILDVIEICQDFVTLLSADGPQFDGGQP